MNIYLWLVRRELWENRAIWMVPAGIGITMIVGALFSPHFDLTFLSHPVSEQVIGGGALAASGGVFFVTATIYGSWYLLESLYADRKDRSILFWKSLPISDADTVLAKLLTAVIVIPLVYFAMADVTTLLVAFILSLRYGALLGRALWHADLWLQLQAIWLYLIVTAALWFLPFSAWLLVVSAWARRAIILWAVLPPLALMVIEYRFMGTGHIASWLGDRTLGYLPRIFSGPHDSADWSQDMLWPQSATGGDSSVSRGIWALFNLRAFFLSPALWTGLVIGAAMVYAAIQLRMRRADL